MWICVLMQKRERERKKERECNKSDWFNQECYAAHLIAGVEEMVRNNNKINKWGEIYVRKCIRTFFFFMETKIESLFSDTWVLSKCSRIKSLYTVFYACVYWRDLVPKSYILSVIHVWSLRLTRKLLLVEDTWRTARMRTGQLWNTGCYLYVFVFSIYGAFR